MVSRLETTHLAVYLRRIDIFLIRSDALMGKYRRSIWRYPFEQAIRKISCIVPVHLLRQEELDTRLPHYSGQAPGESERIWHPPYLHVDAELPLEVLFTVNELSQGTLRTADSHQVQPMFGQRSPNTLLLLSSSPSPKFQGTCLPTTCSIERCFGRNRSLDACPLA